MTRTRCTADPGSRPVREFKRGLNGVCAGTGNTRRRELARIHCLAAELGLTDTAYRDALWAVARVRSAATLDAYGRQRVIEHLASCLPYREPAPRADRYGRPPRTVESRPLLRKIQALLTDAGRPWAYAEALARRVGGADRLELCSDLGLAKIVAALAIDARRRRARVMTPA